MDENEIKVNLFCFAFFRSEEDISSKQIIVLKLQTRFKESIADVAAELQKIVVIAE